MRSLDYTGTPCQMYDTEGKKVWQMELDMYRKVCTFEGSLVADCPFRYQGQYEDIEIGLYCNRYRYYSPDAGIYLSQDLIRLAVQNPTLYGYVKDINNWPDPFGLRCLRSNRKSGTYHWDDYNPAAKVGDHASEEAHLQIHTFQGKTIRIFY